MKRVLAVFLMLAILLTGLTVTASAATTGWQKEGDNWVYYKADGTLLKSDWVQTKGKWYFLNEDGIMVADGIWEIKDKFYAFDKTGAMYANAWYEQKVTYSDGTTEPYWYYADKDGSLVSGWKQIGGKWYYFLGGVLNEETGETETFAPWMIHSAVRTINKKNYAFKPSGEMIVGWGQPWIEYKADGDWATTWFYANPDGSLVEGWKKIDGKWYYLWPNMIRDGVVPFVDGEPGSWDDVAKATLYAFNKSGAMVENAWYKQEHVWTDEDGVKHTDYYWYYAGKDGALKKGWLKDGGKWYYLDALYGDMYADEMYLMSDGKTYAFKASGEMVTGWYQYDDVWFYFKADGAMAEKEWVKSGNSWYYLKEGGQMAKDEILTIDGKPYKFDANGVWVP